MSRMRENIGPVATVVLISCICLLPFGAPGPAQAGFAPTLQGKEGLINMAGWSLGAAALAWTIRYMHNNSPAARSEGYPKETGPGEYFFALYGGYSDIPTLDWKFTLNGTQDLTGVVAKDIRYKPGVGGGLKFGRYFDRAPWFGMELETRFSRNYIPERQGTITPPQPFQPSPLLKEPDWCMIWAIQINLLARYGFFKDKEVTFGRLQPYIGLGTGFNINYGRYDSTKNLALETQAGLKYMMNKTVGVFVEYKFTYQFALEYQDVPVFNTLPNYPINALPANYTFTYDQPHHMVVMGVAFHFKKLYGH
jgi:hypothetical protein